jgi:hypothetical protein
MKQLSGGFVRGPNSSVRFSQSEAHLQYAAATAKRYAPARWAFCETVSPTGESLYPSAAGGLAGGGFEAAGSRGDSLGAHAAGGHELLNVPAVALGALGLRGSGRKDKFFEAVAAGAALILVDGHVDPSSPHMKSALFALFRKPTRHVFVDDTGNQGLVRHSLFHCLDLEPFQVVGR